MLMWLGFLSAREMCCQCLVTISAVVDNLLKRCKVGFLASQISNVPIPAGVCVGGGVRGEEGGGRGP